jgi:hypothetical protein
MSATGGSGLDLLAEHTAAVAGALTAATMAVFAVYSWLIARGGTDAFSSWLKTKAAEECDAAARRVRDALRLKDDVDPNQCASMLADGLEAFRRATATGASRQRAMLVCEYAFVVMVFGVVGLWASFIPGAPLWLETLAFVAWCVAVAAGAFFALDLFRFVKRTGGPPTGDTRSRFAPPTLPASERGSSGLGVRVDTTATEVEVEAGPAATAVETRDAKRSGR